MFYVEARKMAIPQHPCHNTATVGVSEPTISVLTGFKYV